MNVLFTILVFEHQVPPAEELELVPRIRVIGHGLLQKEARIPRAGDHHIEVLRQLNHQLWYLQSGYRSGAYYQTLGLGLNSIITTVVSDTLR